MPDIRPSAPSVRPSAWAGYASDRALATALCLAFVWSPVLAADVTHVIQMSLDGLGAKYLESYLLDAPDQFPNFVRLTTEGAYTFNGRCDCDISETVPNHASILTGRPVYQPAGKPVTIHHGYDKNYPEASDTFHNSGNLNLVYKASVFDVAHDYGRSTAFYAGKSRLGICDRSYDALNGALDQVGEDNGRDKIELAFVADISGANLTNEVNALIQDLTRAAPKRYSFIHLAEPDLTGHAYSWGSPAWSNAVRLVDEQLGRILAAIDANPALSNQTALIVMADHGGGGVRPDGHTESYHPYNYTIPFFLKAPGIPGRSDLYALFENRADPGTNRTDYTTAPQPIRDGDASNLALALLGLPPIPDSFMVPILSTPGGRLAMARFEGRLGVYWADPSGLYVLETAATLSPSAPWETITNGITTAETTSTYTITNATALSRRFFRLRQKLAQ